MAVNPTLNPISIEGAYSGGSTYKLNAITLSSGVSYFSLKDGNTDVTTNTDSWLKTAPAPTGSTVSSLFTASNGKGQLVVGDGSGNLDDLQVGEDGSTLTVSSGTWVWQLDDSSRELYTTIEHMPLNSPMQYYSSDVTNDYTLAYINHDGDVIASGWGKIGILDVKATKIYIEKDTIAVISDANELWLYTKNTNYLSTTTDNPQWTMVKELVSDVVFFHPDYNTNDTDTPADLAIIRTAGTDPVDGDVVAGEVFYIGTNSTNFHPTTGAKTSFTIVGGLDDVARLVIGKNNRSFYAIRNDGRLFVWGKNSSGELGRGSATSNNLDAVTTPSLNANLHNVNPDAFATTGSPGGEGHCTVLCAANIDSTETQTRLLIFGENGGQNTEYTALWGDASGEIGLNSYPMEISADDSQTRDVKNIQGSNSEENPAFAYIAANDVLWVIGGNASRAIDPADTTAQDFVQDIETYATPANNASGGAVLNAGVERMVFVGGYSSTNSREETLLLFVSNGQIFAQGFNLNNMITRAYASNASVTHLTYVTATGHDITRLVPAYVGDGTTVLHFLDDDGIVSSQIANSNISNYKNERI